MVFILFYRNSGLSAITLNGLSADFEKVVAVFQQTIFRVIAERGRSVFNFHFLSCVIGNIILYLGMPFADSRHRTCVVEFSRHRVNERKERVFIDFPEFLVFEKFVNQWVGIISPVERVLTAGIHIQIGCAESIVVVVGNEEDLIGIEILRIEIEIVVVLILPVVIPHSHSDIDGVGFQQKFHITNLHNPGFETLVFLAGDFLYKILQLSLGSRIFRSLSFEFVGLV